MIKNIAFLDADFIIKTHKVKIDSSTLFDEIIKLPYEFIVISKVFNEIHNKEIRNKLTKLVLDGKLKTIANFEQIKNFIDDIDIALLQNLVLSELKKVCELINDSNEFYNSNFKLLESLIYLNDDINVFIKKLDETILKVTTDNNIGEIVTLLNISLLSRDPNIKIISLLSHDKVARESIMSLDDKINSYNCYSCFFLLKENGILTYEIAKKYVSSWYSNYPQNVTVTIIRNKSKVGIDLRKYIEIIYNNNDFKILRNGMLVI